MTEHATCNVLKTLHVARPSNSASSLILWRSFTLSVIRDSRTLSSFAPRGVSENLPHPWLGFAAPPIGPLCGRVKGSWPRRMTISVRPILSFASARLLTSCARQLISKINPTHRRRPAGHKPAKRTNYTIFRAPPCERPNTKFRTAFANTVRNRGHLPYFCSKQMYEIPCHALMTKSPYWGNWRSCETILIPSLLACASNMRSNGSLW